jgi:hypothetical protein
MKFDIYGRFIIEVVRVDGGWKVYRTSQGRKVEMNDVAIPADAAMERIPYYLEDLWHESAAPGKTIRRVD